MPKRDDIKTVMIIGSGPVVIGQAGELDCAGLGACRALRAGGRRVVVANSNPSALMTDPGEADATYIEPLNAARLAQIIAREKPDALLNGFGGQAALNLSGELLAGGVLGKHGVRLLGAGSETLRRCGEREVFAKTMRAAGIGAPESRLAHTIEEAEAAAAALNYPVVVRPDIVTDASGVDLVYNVDELRAVVSRLLSLSSGGRCVVEEALLGWEEFELEVLRDTAGAALAVCLIEEVDAAGVHAGDSLCVAPALSVPQGTREELRKTALAAAAATGVAGCAGVRLARNPRDGRIAALGVNPRASRSTALAARVTGFPVASAAARLALGLPLSEIGAVPAPGAVAVRFPRWDFGKFKGARDELDTRQKAVGEVVGMGANYKEAFLKAVRSLGGGREGGGLDGRSREELLALLAEAGGARHFVLLEALRKGASVAEVCARVSVKEWFVRQAEELVALEKELAAQKDAPEDALLARAVAGGFSPECLAKILGADEAAVRGRVRSLCGAPGWGAIPVSGGNSACFFSTRHAAGGAPDAGKPGKILILGGGPNRIGQGLEFDHGCVNAAAALREAGHAAVLVNCNPAAVSTDAALAGPLYLEPLTTGDVLEICEREKPRGVIAQFGGQVAAGVARGLAAAGVALLGTSAEAAAVAGDRGRFRELLKRLGIPTPEGGEAAGADEAVALAERLGYPVMARIADGRGGETAEVVHDAAMLRERVGKAGGRPVFLDRFLRDALECEADALADGEDVFIPAVMEHIELAGVHSGDAACVLPPVSLSPERVETMRAHTRAIARELRVAGLMNVQFAAGVEGVFVLKATPRASRTVPLVSKVCGLPLARLAARLALGAKLADLKLPAGKTIPRFGVKESVFPFGRFPDVDPVLGPEMRSTGSVLGLSPDFGLAFRKSQEAAQSPLPSSGAVLISVRERVPQVLEIARTFAACGFRLKATSGTRRFLADNGIAADLAVKINEGRPDIADDIRNRLIQLVINTPVDRRGAYVDDSYIRKAAIRYNVPCMTTLAAAAAAARGVAALRGAPDVIGESLQEYHAGLR